MYETFTIEHRLPGPSDLIIEFWDKDMLSDDFIG